MPQANPLSPRFDEGPPCSEPETLRARIARLIDLLAAAEHHGDAQEMAQTCRLVREAITAHFIIEHRLRIEAGEANGTPDAEHRADELRRLHGRVDGCLEYCLTGSEKRCAQWYAEHFRRHLENRALAMPPALA